jgi:hypothetical protein
MITRLALAALAATALLASSVSSNAAQAQVLQPASGAPNAGPTGTAPQLPTSGGAQAPYPVGPTIQRWSGQDCRGVGQCAWRGQSEQAASCTSDARVCTSQGAGPNWPSVTCTTFGAVRTCSCASSTAVSPYSLPGTAGMSSPTQPGTVMSLNTLPNGSPQPGVLTSPNTLPNGTVGMGNGGITAYGSPTGLSNSC